jgi:DNA-binding IclR family transcriptional regulator
MFDLPVDECARILTTLVNDGSLRQDETGRYRLAS